MIWRRFVLLFVVDVMCRPPGCSHVDWIVPCTGAVVVGVLGCAPSHPCIHMDPLIAFDTRACGRGRAWIAPVPPTCAAPIDVCTGGRVACRRVWIWSSTLKFHRIIWSWRYMDFILLNGSNLGTEKSEIDLRSNLEPVKIYNLVVEIHEFYLAKRISKLYCTYILS